MLNFSIDKGINVSACNQFDILQIDIKSSILMIPAGQEHLYQATLCQPVNQKKEEKDRCGLLLGKWWSKKPIIF